MLWLRETQFIRSPASEDMIICFRLDIFESGPIEESPTRASRNLKGPQSRATTISVANPHHWVSILAGLCCRRYSSFPPRLMLHNLPKFSMVAG